MGNLVITQQLASQKQVNDEDLQHKTQKMEIIFFFFFFFLLSSLRMLLVMISVKS